MVGDALVGQFEQLKQFCTEAVAWKTTFVREVFETGDAGLKFGVGEGDGDGVTFPEFGNVCETHGGSGVDWLAVDDSAVVHWPGNGEVFETGREFAR